MASTNFVMVDGTRYTGLETPGMKKLSCSLAIQPSMSFSAAPIVLDPCRVVVPQDGGSPKHVAFQGCTIVQLHPTGKRDAHAPASTEGLGGAPLHGRVEAQAREDAGGPGLREKKVYWISDAQRSPPMARLRISSTSTRRRSWG